MSVQLRTSRRVQRLGARLAVALGLALIALVTWTSLWPTSAPVISASPWPPVFLAGTGLGLLLPSTLGAMARSAERVQMARWMAAIARQARQTEGALAAPMGVGPGASTASQRPNATDAEPGHVPDVLRYGQNQTPGRPASGSRSPACARASPWARGSGRDFA